MPFKIPHSTLNSLASNSGIRPLASGLYQSHSILNNAPKSPKPSALICGYPCSPVGKTPLPNEFASKSSYA
ncbi:hypothetical protein IAD21_03059 [Abditibacteriota bacterium]|nr:hypothetical protein IAD21_03059 [Abditibacteriota bacterium]